MKGRIASWGGVGAPSVWLQRPKKPENKGKGHMNSHFPSKLVKLIFSFLIACLHRGLHVCVQVHMHVYARVCESQSSALALVHQVLSTLLF